MIDHNLKAIYLHIGKTAGASIEHLMSAEKRDALKANRKILFGYDKEEQIYLQHANAKTVLRLAGNEIFNQYYKFSIVRNPFSRLLSVYHYSIHQHEKQYGNFKGYIESLPEIFNRRTHSKGSHHSCQTDYTHIDQEYVLDYVGKFEDLPYSLVPVRKKLKIAGILERRNSHRSKNWGKRSVASYYSSSMKRIVQNLYETDFICFDYSPDPKDIPFSYWAPRVKNAKRIIKPYTPKIVRKFVRDIRRVYST